MIGSQVSRISLRGGMHIALRRSPQIVSTIRTLTTEISEDPSHYKLTRQPSPYSSGKHRSNALDLIKQQPVIEVDSEFAVCDGGGGALGHPLEYIQLARRPVGDEVVSCIYCGLRYKMKSKT